MTVTCEQLGVSQMAYTLSNSYIQLLGIVPYIATVD